MSADRRDRPTEVRGVPTSDGQVGGRDDKTRVRLPTVGGAAATGRSRDADATRHIRSEGGAASRGRPAGGDTVRMQIVPKRFAWLIVKTGPRVGQVNQLGDITDLGRGASGGIVIDDDRVSEQHARVRVDDEGQFVLWDLASTNGTFVNGERISAATLIVENDEVKVGNTVLVLKILDIND